jgi:hypothetical protein
MTTLILRRASVSRRSGEWQHFDVFDGDRDVGRIYCADASSEVWFWDVKFMLTRRRCYGKAKSLDEAKAMFKAEYEKWLSRASARRETLPRSGLAPASSSPAPAVAGGRLDAYHLVLPRGDFPVDERGHRLTERHPPGLGEDCGNKAGQGCQPTRAANVGSPVNRQMGGR